jgi:hypothetical protein
LASQPTLSRFQTAISIQSLKRLRDVFLHIDQFVMLSLRPGNVHADPGADDDLAYLGTRLWQGWPDVAL